MSDRDCTFWWGTDGSRVDPLDPRKITSAKSKMPRTLSGLKTGDFDTLEVVDKFEAKGEMVHSGETPPEFRHLKVGESAPDIPDGTWP